MGSCSLLVMVLKTINHKGHSSTSLRITSSHDHSRLSWYTWLRGGHLLCLCMREDSLDVPLIRSVDEAAAEQIEVCPAKHVAFQHFQAIDMTLHRATRPRQGHSRFDGGIVVAEPTRKA